MPNEQNKSSKIPYFFFAFFAVVFAVNLFFIYVAKKTWRGVATEDAYRKGVNYNQTLKAVEQQKKLGWKMTMKYSTSGKKTGIVKIDLTDKNSQKITDAQVVINCKRPIEEGFDFSQKIEFNGKSYQTKMSFPLAGQWNFEVVVRRNSDIFQEVKRYVIQ